MKTSITSFDRITSLENIRGAYFDLVRKFDEDSKSKRYRGADGLSLAHLDFISEEVMIEVQKEMLALQEIAPAYLATIPKKDGRKRKIYVYPVKERLKAEAVYRALEQFFESYFSDFLFSYRSSHPSYYAARSAVRRYKRYYGENHVLVTDISDYADSIDHEILLKKISGLGFDKNTEKILGLFITTKTLEYGKLVTRPRGVLTGTPLYALLSNFFMDDFDKWAGKYVAFYRRVGDDMIAMDKSAEKIKTVHTKLAETVATLKLKTNMSKVSLIKDTETFKFLGYQFSNGKIGFDGSSMAKARTKWKLQLGRSGAKSLAAKMRSLRNLNRKKTGRPDQEFAHLIDQKILVDDTHQIRRFSDSLTGTLASHLFGFNTPHKRRLAAEALKSVQTRPLLTHYWLTKFWKK